MRKGLSQAFSAPIPEVDSLRYPRRFVYRYNSPFSVSRQFNLISCMRKTLTGKIAARLTSPQFPRIDQISPKSCRASGTIHAHVFHSAEVRNRSFDTTSFEFPCLSAFFTGRVPELL